MKNNNLTLIKIKKTHLPILFNWRNEATFITNCTGRKKIESIEKFDSELRSDFKRDRHLQFLVLLKEKPIGTIYSYALNTNNKYAFITVYIEPKYANYSYGIKSFVIFADFLFKELDLFKIYFDIYTFNKKMISIIGKYNFSLEGVFKNQHLIQNKRYDVHRYGFYKRDMPFWYEKLDVNSDNIIHSKRIKNEIPTKNL